MAVAGNRSIAISFTGDVNAPSLIHSAAENAASPGEIESVVLASGNNTITPPVGFKAVTILPPAGNTNLITLKGVNGDTGVPLHKTDPTSIGLDSTVVTFVLNAAAETTVRLIWS